MHLRAIVRRRASLQPCCSLRHATPSLHERAEARSILQANLSKPIIDVEGDVSSSLAISSTDRCEIDQLITVGCQGTNKTPANMATVLFATFSLVAAQADDFSTCADTANGATGYYTDGYTLFKQVDCAMHTVNPPTYL